LAYHPQNDADPDPNVQFDADSDPQQFKLLEKPSALKREH
jgi:hypothetical protein